MGLFWRKAAENKRTAQVTMYAMVQRFLRRHVDGLMLLGGNPTPGVRLMASTVARGKQVTGYEKDLKTQIHICTKLAGLYTLCARMGSKFSGRMEGIEMAPSHYFEDIDLCGAWISNRNLIKDRFSRGLPWVHLIPHSCALGLLRTRLLMQQSLHGRKAFAGTITTRAGITKPFSVECLNHLLEVIGVRIKSIDGLKSGYGKGIRLPGSGTSKYYHRQGTPVCRTDYARLHVVELEFIAGHSQQANSVQLLLFTYKDTSEMLTFCINYNN